MLDGMCASSHRELRAWRAADDVRRRILKLCARPDVKRDFGFCDQAERASASACRNIAEGFARFGNPEFARFVSIARGSLGELHDSIDEARLKGYLTESDWKDFDRAIRAARAMATGLRRYLLRSQPPAPAVEESARRPEEAAKARQTPAKPARSGQRPLEARVARHRHR